VVPISLWMQKANGQAACGVLIHTVDDGGRFVMVVVRALGV
jgi:hypothetical protein